MACAVSLSGNYNSDKWSPVLTMPKDIRSDVIKVSIVEDDVAFQNALGKGPARCPRHASTL